MIKRLANANCSNNTAKLLPFLRFGDKLLLSTFRHVISETAKSQVFEI